MRVQLLLNLFLLLVILALAVQAVWSYFRIKRSAKIVDNETFKENMKKGQIIDVREKAEFNATHILGARSLPWSTLKDSGTAIRKDQPIFLYDNDRRQAGRSAILLKKMGHREIYILKNGYKAWDGKVKKRQ